MCMRARARWTKLFCCVTFCTTGSFILLVGFYTLQHSQQVSHDLLHACGGDRMSLMIENEWQKLSNFYEDCSHDMGGKPPFIQECPGFGKFQRNNSHVTYIEDVEDKFFCVGFCHFSRKPLFNEDAVNGRRC